MPQLFLIVPLIACYLDIARPFKHVPPLPLCVMDVRSELSAFEVPTMELIAKEVR